MRNENILQVAIQCPSSGGQSVHRARIFIAIVNDSIEYNDGNVCATMGIFRMANPNGKNNLEPKLICFPNPASSSLQLTFDGSIDSLNQLIGNLASNSPYIDPTYPFKGFYEGQRYRLKVRYANCGNFIEGNFDNSTLESVMIKSEIINKMWLCGKKQDHNIDPMYNTVAALQASLNMTIYPNDPIYQLMDTSYTNNRLFFCETFGGVHYFFSQDARNISSVVHADGCDKSLLITARMVAAGYPYAINMYPFEYRPPMLWPTSYEVNVPAGYYVSNVEMQHEFFFVDSSGSRVTNWIPLPLPNTVVGNFTLYDNTLPSPVCFTDSLYPFLLTDTNMYVITGRTDRVLKLKLSPLSCDSSSHFFSPSDSIAIIYFNNHHYGCIDTTTCTLTEITRRATAPQNNWVFTLLPNLVVQTAPITINVIGNQICTQIIFKNASSLFSGVSSSTASNVFLALPDPASVPFLHNWVYYSPDTIYPLGQIIRIDTLFNINKTDTGLLCASLINCYGNFRDSATFTFHTGWNCDGFPNSPFDADSVCGATAQTITLIKEDAGLSNTAKAPNTNSTYSLCDTIYAHADFTSTKSGYLYPNFVNVDTISGLGILAVYLKRDTTSVLLTYNSNNQNFPITASNMISLGFSDSAFYSGSMIRVEVLFIPTCNFIEDSLPFIQFNAIDYCGTVHNTVASYDGILSIEGSKCHDCFTLTKTASDSTIAALDTMSFNIIICPNNDGPSWVGLTEVLPANFFATSTIPTFVYIDSIECDTIVVEGYFTQAGPCIDNTNIAKISYLDYDSLNHFTIFSDTLTATACVEVSVSCVDPNTIIIKDSSYSHNYSSTYSNTSFYVEGLFTIDSNLTLINCTVFMAAGAQIIIVSNVMFSLDSNTSIIGCDTMWQGILMEPGAAIEVFNGSKISDANKAIQIDDECEVYLKNAQLNNNITGIYTAPDAFANIYSIHGFSITGTTFSFNGSFLPNYIGQPTHGAAPYAGIDLSDVVVNIGEAGASANHFLNMNFGIKSFRSIIEVANCDFQNIYSVTGYSSKLIGTAVVSEGDPVLGVHGTLSVFPLSSNAGTIINCERGVYASFSDLIVSGCKILNVITGVECTGNKFMRRAIVTENIISARKYGIRFYDNAGAASMSAIFNSITINGSTSNGATMGTAISVMEKNNTAQANYDISYNAPITIIDGHAGIELSSVYKPKVGCNNVLQKIGSGQAISTIGIDLKSCVGAQVTQNLVKGYSTTNTSRIGVNTDQSINSLISCNSVDSTGFGFHFTSSNLNTNFRGNIMRNHFEGLHLTNTAVIDTQKVAGNRWIGNYLSGFGAVNLNVTPPPNVFKSLFMVNPINPTFSPSVPVNNSNWFRVDSLPNYVCSNINPCSSVEMGFDGGDVNLMELIALDSSLTSDYVDESRDIAQSILFDFLMTDSVLRNSSSIFTAFINSNLVLQSLYEVKLQYHDLRNAEDSAAILLLTLDSSIKVMVDTLRYYNQAVVDNSSLDLSTEINQANISLNIMKAAYSTLVQQFKIRENAILLNAEFYNSQVNAMGLPLENEETINGVQIMYELYGKDSIAGQFSIFLSIAQQCPSQGGSAVYRARFFVSLFNDSLTYDDFSVCLAQGYYREMNSNSNQENVEPRLTLKPNPANEIVEVILDNGDEKDYLLRISDLEGRNVYIAKRTASELKTIINTSELSPGVYFVLVDDSSGLILCQKLIIVR